MDPVEFFFCYLLVCFLIKIKPTQNVFNEGNNALQWMFCSSTVTYSLLLTTILIIATSLVLWSYASLQGAASLTKFNKCTLCINIYKIWLVNGVNIFKQLDFLHNNDRSNRQKRVQPSLPYLLLENLTICLMQFTPESSTCVLFQLNKTQLSVYHAACSI